MKRISSDTPSIIPIFSAVLKILSPTAATFEATPVLVTDV